MCDCIKKMNEALKRDFEGAALGLIIFWDGTPARIAIETVAGDKQPGKRKPKAPNLLASFCPLCGEKYPDSKPNSLSRADEFEEAARRG